jgi:thiamine-phosphate pyrophosphorylase
MGFQFPSRVYPIADAGAAAGQRPLDLVAAVLAAGCRLVQLRMKDADTRTFVEVARAAKALSERYEAALIINDRTDIAHLIDAAGVHLGQDDLPPAAARAILGPSRIIGTSTHSIDQLSAAVALGIADYIAYGPVFATTSKERPDPVQGIDTLRQARALTTRPLVAIGGITAANAASVLATGVDAVAVIGAIAAATDPVAATRQLVRASASVKTLPES